MCIYMYLVPCGGHSVAENSVSPFTQAQCTSSTFTLVALPFHLICSMKKCDLLKGGLHQVRISRTSTGALYVFHRFSGLLKNFCDLYMFAERQFLDRRSWQYA